MKCWLAAIFLLAVNTRCAPLVTPLPDDGMRYNEVLFAGTHNSAINLGSGTLLRPSDAIGGDYPSEVSCICTHDTLTRPTLPGTP